MEIGDIAEKISGLLIPGGRDLMPSYYNENTLFSIEPESPERIKFEFSLLREIIRLKKPVMGICYGMQIVNVMHGGSLYQDIRSQLGGTLDHRQGSHSISVLDNPFLWGGRQTVNSSHHQGVKKLGEGLVSFATAEDGLVEAFYREGYGFLVGVQWHPERMEGPWKEGLFRRFVGECLAG
jgi:putative glutamine amidotransferase